MNDLIPILESLLFVAEEPLTVDKLNSVLELTDKSEIRTALETLREILDNREGGFYLREVAGGWQLRTRPEYHEWIKRMLQPSPQRLSRAALETLAIVAYKQPVIRADIEYIRGVDSGGVLRQLMERKLIRVLGRKEIPGRPLIYATTKLFLELFDLKDLKDLPSPKEIEELSGSARPEAQAPDATGSFEDEDESETEPPIEGMTQDLSTESPAEAQADAKNSSFYEEQPASNENDEQAAPHDSADLESALTAVETVDLNSEIDAEQISTEDPDTTDEAPAKTNAEAQDSSFHEEQPTSDENDEQAAPHDSADFESALTAVETVDLNSEIDAEQISTEDPDTTDEAPAEAQDSSSHEEQPASDKNDEQAASHDSAGRDATLTVVESVEFDSGQNSEQVSAEDADTSDAPVHPEENDDNRLY